MHYSFGETYFEIKDTDTIWILSAGPSLDFFNPQLIKPGHIVITINSVLSIFKHPDFHIGSDIASINGYKDYWSKPTIWFAKESNREVLHRLGIQALFLGDLIDRQFKGSGSDAILLAYYLHTYKKEIKFVHYVGLDFSEITHKGHRYYYNSKVKVLDWQKKSQLPKDWHKSKNYIATCANYKSYSVQLNTINNILHAVPDFKRKLVSHSFMDFKKGDRPMLRNNRWKVPCTL